MKKTGDPRKVVNKAYAQATTVSGVVGIKISILPPDAHIHDRVVIDEKVKANIKTPFVEEVEPEKKKKTPKKKTRSKK